MVMTHHMQKVKVKGHWVQKLEFTLKARYDLNCVKSAVKPQSTHQPTKPKLGMETDGWTHGWRQLHYLSC